MVNLEKIAHHLFGFPDDYDPIQFVISPFRFISPLTLFNVRVFLCVYVLVIRIWTEDINGEDNNIYFTVLSYWHLLSYLAFVLVISIKMKSWNLKYDDMDFSKPSEFCCSPDTHFTRFCKYLTVSSEVLTSLTMGIVIVFWGLLYDSSKPFVGAELFENISVHGFNALFTLTDLFMCCRKIYPKQICYLLFWLLLYMLSTMIYHHSTSIWVYPFLNYFSPFATGYYIGILVLFVILYYFGYGLQRFRDFLSIKINGERGPVIEMRATPK
eukprot:TRINITY_DN5837_c0_g1_i5.p1 TRINITY_DN5837_c0_g1~~TRINITY_DN5837_c0_g1_i5.p1  ORF type:complete len:269 (-),score=29.21 TRINITY_DN5837_c0_g1_i5:127-933(-)